MRTASATDGRIARAFDQRDLHFAEGRAETALSSSGDKLCRALMSGFGPLFQRLWEPTASDG